MLPAERLERQDRLRLLDATLLTLERGADVLAAVAASQDEDDAVRRVAALLGLDDPVVVSQVLGLPLRRWTRLQRESLRRTRDQLRVELGDDARS